MRKIAVLLTAVLLATVLTPSFGWEASAGPQAHDQGAAGLDEICGVPDGHDRENSESDTHHHGCATHMLGHLVADIFAVAVFTPPESGSRRLAGPLEAVLSGFPERLYRPPLARLLA